MSSPSRNRVKRKQPLVPYTVSGRWPFPLDMLHYDDSRPASPEDAALIERLSAEQATLEDLRQDVDVRLLYVGLNKFFQPCKERWESFLWKVKEQ